MAVEFSTKIQVASEMCTALINQNAKLKNDSLGTKINLEIHNATCGLYFGVGEYLSGKTDVELKNKCENLYMTIDLSRERAAQNKTILTASQNELIIKNITWAESAYTQLCDIPYMNRSIITDSAIKIKIQKLNVF
ncbi:MAG: hypothetical protein L6Q37_02770 [Bdellovibrionaceae bacterium]|nr:hypothetical protein [Pseudobdellovibrionaceae bacterium]